MKFAATSVLALALAAQEASGLSYTTGNSDNTVRDLTLKNRAYVPYGPDLTTDPIQDSSEVWSGYGYAMAAAEHIAYDPKEGYLYVQGEAGVSRSTCTSAVRKIACLVSLCVWLTNTQYVALPCLALPAL